MCIAWIDELYPFSIFGAPSSVIPLDRTMILSFLIRNVYLCFVNCLCHLSFFLCKGIPAYIEHQDNQLFRAVSIAFCAKDSLASELRIRCCIEMVLFDQYYQFQRNFEHFQVAKLFFMIYLLYGLGVIFLSGIIYNLFYSAQLCQFLVNSPLIYYSVMDETFKSVFLKTVKTEFQFFDNSVSFLLYQLDLCPVVL